MVVACAQAAPFPFNMGSATHRLIRTHVYLSVSTQHFLPFNSLNCVFASQIGDRRKVEAQVADQLGVEASTLATVPLPVRRAMWRGGLSAMLEAGYKPRGAAAKALESGTVNYDVQYWKRQYVFVAATMPAALETDAGACIKQQYPDALWLSGELLHRSKPQVRLFATAI